MSRLLVVAALLAGCAEEPRVVRYQNPIDGKAQPMRVYAPPGGVRETPGNVALQQVVLLTREEDVGKRVATEALAGYMKDIEAALRSVQQPAGTAGQLVVDVSLQEFDKPVYFFAMRPPPPNGELVRLLNLELVKIAKPTVTGPVHFQVWFRVGPAGP